MLKIRKNEIEHEGGIAEMLADMMMLTDFVYDEVEAELGHIAATKLLLKLLLRVIKRKGKERHGLSKACDEEN